jgi:hypothetical protein
MAAKKRGSSAASTSPATVSEPLPTPPPVVPASVRRPPQKIGLLKRWWIFYEGSFALSMLETVSCCGENRLAR